VENNLKGSFIKLSREEFKDRHFQFFVQNAAALTYSLQATDMTKLGTLELLKVCVFLELLLLDVDGETNYGNSMSHMASPS